MAYGSLFFFFFFREPNCKVMLVSWKLHERVLWQKEDGHTLLLVQASCRMLCQSVEENLYSWRFRVQGSPFLHQQEVCCVLELWEPEEKALKYQRAGGRRANLLPRCWGSEELPRTRSHSGKLLSFPPSLHPPSSETVSTLVPSRGSSLKWLRFEAWGFFISWFS